MTITFGVDAHARAVASIQALLSKHRPGSSLYCIAERALDLAFNSPFLPDAGHEEALLAEAEQLIQRQLRAGLIPGPSKSQTRARPFAAVFTRRSPRLRTWRPPAPDGRAKVELRLTIVEQGRRGHVHFR